MSLKFFCLVTIHQQKGSFSENMRMFNEERYSASVSPGFWPTEGLGPLSLPAGGRLPYKYIWPWVAAFTKARSWW